MLSGGLSILATQVGRGNEWHDGKEWYYRSFNFLSIWNLRRVHIRAAVCFYYRGPLSRRPNGSIPSPLLAPLAPRRRHLLLCISRKWHFQNQCIYLSFPPKCIYSGQSNSVIKPRQCILHREEGDVANRKHPGVSDAILNIILSKGTLSRFMGREIMWKPDLRNNIGVRALHWFLRLFHTSLQSVQMIRWVHKSHRAKIPAPCFSKNKTNPSKYLIKVTICWAAGRTNPPKPSTKPAKKEKLILSFFFFFFFLILNHFQNLSAGCSTTVHRETKHPEHHHCFLPRVCSLNYHKSNSIPPSHLNFKFAALQPLPLLN